MVFLYKQSVPHGIMFHHFHDSVHPVGQGSISAEQFADMLNFLGRKRILNAEEWISRVQSNSLEKGDLCITFDDNLRCQYDVAVPVLQSYDIKPFWFVYSSVIEGNLEWLELYRYFRTTQFENIEDFYQQFFKTIENSPFAFTVKDALKDFSLSNYLVGFDFYSENDKKFRFIRDQILKVPGYNRVMALMLENSKFRVDEVQSKLWMDESMILDLKKRGHVIGLHSYSHPTNMIALSAAEQGEEYRLNFNHLHKILGEPPTSMSHPCNSYEESTLEILKDLGIKVGFRANMKILNTLNHLEIPREDHANIIKIMRAL